jgi:hypothetical protein
LEAIKGAMNVPTPLKAWAALIRNEANFGDPSEVI